jgi:serine protease Do
MSFTATGNLCVNERTLYAPLDDGKFRRVIVLGEARAMDILTIDPDSGEFRRERYPLNDEDFAAANQAVAESGAGRGCSGEGASDAVAQRNEALMRYAQGTPRQRLVWRCEARN